MSHGDIVIYLDQIKNYGINDTIKNRINDFLNNNRYFIPVYINNDEELTIHTVFIEYDINILKILSNIIATNKNINIYNFYKLLLINTTTLLDSDLVIKYSEILKYCLNSKFFTQRIIDKFIYYYSVDLVWGCVKDYLIDNHYIYKGVTVLNLSFGNIPLFDYLLNDAIDKQLYDPEGNRFNYYTNNHLLCRNLDYEISIFMNKCNAFREYILARLPKKYKFLKNYKKVQSIIVKNNIAALEYYFNCYSKFLTPNSRLNYNYPLLDSVNSLEMFYYLLKKGANINSLSIEPAVFTEIRYSEFYFTNTIYNNSQFVLDNIEHYYKAGADFSVNKLAMRKLIKIHHKLFLESLTIYYYNRLLSISNKYINRTKNKAKKILHNKFCKDLVTNIVKYI